MTRTLFLQAMALRALAVLAALGSLGALAADAPLFPSMTISAPSSAARACARQSKQLERAAANRTLWAMQSECNRNRQVPGRLRIGG